MGFSLRPFLTAFIGSFAGKLLATLFIAVCVALGAGPDTWAQWLLGAAVNVETARLLFILLAVVTAVALGFSLRRQATSAVWRIDRNALSKMRAVLTEMSSGVFISRDNDAVEADPIYRQFEALFSEMHWAVHGGVVFGVKNPSRTGVTLFKYPNMDGPTLTTVRKALIASGVKFEERDSNDGGDLGMPQIAFSTRPLSLD